MLIALVQVLPEILLFSSTDSLLVREVNLRWTDQIIPCSHARTDLQEPARVMVPSKFQNFPDLFGYLALVQARIYILIHKVWVFDWFRGFLHEVSFIT